MLIRCERCDKQMSVEDFKDVKCKCGRGYSTDDLYRIFIESFLNENEVVVLKNISNYLHKSYSCSFLIDILRQGIASIMREHSDIDFCKDTDMFTTEQNLLNYNIIPRSAQNIHIKNIANDKIESGSIAKQVIYELNKQIGRNRIQL